jgi:hypothetical protein
LATISSTTAAPIEWPISIGGDGNVPPTRSTSVS